MGCYPLFGKLAKSPAELPLGIAQEKTWNVSIG
jgi:D-hexose-6-phosphate mutarotase